MRLIGVIQARASSRRLPGKVLLDLAGRPSLDYTIEALRHAETLSGISVATSTHASDDATAAFVDARGIACHRGPLDNVALRLLQAGETLAADAVVRISGDSPLIDPRLIDDTAGIFLREAGDITTNVWPRCFPKGQSVEVIAMEALRTAIERMTTNMEREHVTPYFYAHPADFVIRSLVIEDGRPDVQLSIDSVEDFARCRAILEIIGVPPWQVGWRACVAAFDKHMARARTGALS